jgi:hypothetical protein
MSDKFMLWSIWLLLPAALVYAIYDVVSDRDAEHSEGKGK